MDKKTIVVATKNPGKAKEFKNLFQDKYQYKVETLLDHPELKEVEETGTSFEENAILKAKEIAKQLNKLVIADDSGLVVEALGGAPGIYSARYAGPEKSDQKNNEKLLKELDHVNSKNRQAYFNCTLALAGPQAETITVNGRLEGEIAYEEKGSNGFGYDPLFYLPALGKHLAELSQDKKNEISHRAIALEKLDQLYGDRFLTK